MKHLFLVIQGSVFLPAECKSDVYFRPENLENTEKDFFPDYRDYQIRWHCSLVAGCDGTRLAHSALHFVLRCLQLAL